jgi:mRNA-degrading endonuclease RelE of RelBE toxin-antitoxin system
MRDPQCDGDVPTARTRARESQSHQAAERGLQAATYRLRVGDYRVFYDVAEGEVFAIAVLHKGETADFYRKDTP